MGALLLRSFLLLVRQCSSVDGALKCFVPCPLQAQFGLSQEQAEGVLGMTLRRLTSLETSKLQDEQAQLQARWAPQAHGWPLALVC